MSIIENCQVSTRALEIIDRDLKNPEEKKLVAQILNNYYTRGLLWEVNDRDIYGVNDEVVAVTELIVLTNCLRGLFERQNGKGVASHE